MALANSAFEKALAITTLPARMKANHIPGPTTSWAKAGRRKMPDPNIDDSERITSVFRPMVRAISTVFSAPIQIPRISVSLWLLSPRMGSLSLNSCPITAEIRRIPELFS